MEKNIKSLYFFLISWAFLEPTTLPHFELLCLWGLERTWCLSTVVFQSFSHLQPTFWSNADSSVVIYLGSTRSTAILCWYLLRGTVLLSGYFSPEYTDVGICRSQDLGALSSNGVALPSGGIQLSYSVWLAYPCHMWDTFSSQSVCFLAGTRRKWLTSGFREATS